MNFSKNIFFPKLLGIAARIIYVFVVSFCSSLEIKEQGFLAFAFCPKGTFQVIAPTFC
jgi:hypothetical protein